MQEAPDGLEGGRYAPISRASQCLFHIPNLIACEEVKWGGMGEKWKGSLDEICFSALG